MTEYPTEKPPRRTKMRHRDIERRYEQMAEYRRRRWKSDPAFRQRLREQSKRHRTPEAHRAGEAVRRAIKRGDLVRPSSCSCCGEVAVIEAAHHDYSKPLEVAWLCRSCHRRWDRDQPKSQRTQQLSLEASA